MIEGEAKECLIDSGAQTSFISERYAKSRQFKREKIATKKRWVTANNSKLEVAGQTLLTLKIGREEIKATFIIAQNLSADVIIGVDILDTKFTLDFKNSKLLYENESIEIQTRSNI
jgi:predicted aspartyl protease